MFVTVSVKCVYIIFILMTFAKMSKTQRKIKDGAQTQEIKRYMVYLIQAKESPRNYDEWLCGGAIIGEKMIITSAACVTDVEYMYAIAGYNKYVRFDDIDKNPCTQAMKRKVTKSCVPMAYTFEYDKVDKWAQIDIAVVEVETPYDFNAPPLSGCTHAPDKIDINYDAKYQKPSTDVFMLGWGHKSVWRESTVTSDLNNELLNYGSTLILEKEYCKSDYSIANPELVPIIDKYMICTLDHGNLDDTGRVIGNNTAKGLKNGCRRQDGIIDENCIYRRSTNLTNPEINIPSITSVESSKGQALPKSKITSMGTKGIKELIKDKKEEDKIVFSELLEQTESKILKTVEGKYDIQEEKNLARKFFLESNEETNKKGEDTVVFADLLQPTESKISKTERHETLVDTEGDEDTILNQSNSTNIIRGTKINTRKQGLCQNDHGGPLIAWRGTKEILIGVASVFQITANNECTGPYLFTSTHCNSLFLDCTINGGKNVQRMGPGDYVVRSGPELMDPDRYLHEQFYESRRESLDENGMAPECKRPPSEMGFRFEFRRINWDNSNIRSGMPQIKTEEQMMDDIKIRPQIPLSMLKQTGK